MSIIVIPPTTIDNPANLGDINAILFSQGFAKLGIGTADFLNLLARYFSSSKKTLASFCNHILYIVRVAAKKQVVWANAWGIVTAMKHFFSFRNRSVVQYPTCAMSADLPMKAIGRDQSIAEAAFAGGPNPAAIVRKLFHGFPKPICKRLGVRCANSLFSLAAAREGIVFQIPICDFFLRSAITAHKASAQAPAPGSIGNHKKASKFLSDEGYFGRHNDGNDIVAFSGGRPATTGAHCEYVLN